LKKVKNNWSHELKYATTTTERKDAKVRAKLKTIGSADVNAGNFHLFIDTLVQNVSLVF